MIPGKKFSNWYQRTNVALSVFQFGAPLEGYETKNLTKQEEDEIMLEWLKVFHETLPAMSDDRLHVIYDGKPQSFEN